MYLDQQKKCKKNYKNIYELKMALNPMHQFEVYKIGPEINIGGVNLSFTNASFFMVISSILILSYYFLEPKKNH